MIGLLLGCAQPPKLPDACTVMRAAGGQEPMAAAREWIAEARRTGDAGLYTLADTALDCRGGADPEVTRLRAHVWIQFHRFAEVEAMARSLPGDGLDHALLGDACMEQGKLDCAAEAYQRAVDLRPGLEMYDRIGWLRWLEGDVPGSREMAEMAVAAGSPGEPLAWALTRLGWLRALSGEPAPELDAALKLLPGYKPALYARGRIRLGTDPAAEDDLRAVGATVEARVALNEIVPVDVAGVRAQDPRGYAIFLAPTDPAAALLLLDEEWKARQDATTRMARAWALHHLGRPEAAPEARQALATGIVEPRVLYQGGIVLGDQVLLERALAMGPGLLPSERRAAERASVP